MAATIVPVTPNKQPCPEGETTGNVAPPQKRIKKKAKKGEREILVISSQNTGAIAPSISLSPPVVEATVRGLQNPPMAQATEVQPTIPAVIQPIVAPLVEVPITPKLVVTPAIGLVTAAIGKTATMAEKNPPLNPKKKTIIVVEEEVRPFC